MSRETVHKGSLEQFIRDKLKVGESLTIYIDETEEKYQVRKLK